jgi:hypothetical protein
MTSSRRDPGQQQEGADTDAVRRRPEPPTSPDLPGPIAPNLMGVTDLRGTALATDPPRGPALPFSSAGAPAARALENALAHAADAQGPLPPRRAVGSGTVDASDASTVPPAPAAPPGGLSLEQCASLEVELAVGRTSRAEILRRYGLSEEQYPAVARYWEGRMARDGTILARWNQAMMAYRDWLSQEQSRSSGAVVPVSSRSFEPRPSEPSGVIQSPATTDQSPWAAGARHGHADEPPAVPSPTRNANLATPSPFNTPTAAAAPDTRGNRAPVHDPAPRPTASPVRADPVDAIELIWFDPEVVPRVRRKAEWRPLLDALERKAPDPVLDDPAFASDPTFVEDRREVFEVLANAAPMSADGLDAALGACLREDGKFAPSVELAAGELELPFDELAWLRATLTTVAPLVGADEALKSAVLAAKDFLTMPGLMSAPAVADGLTKRIEDAFTQGKRVVPAGYLEAQRERALLENRAYQRRAVFGAKHLRGLIRPGTVESAAKLGRAPAGNAVMVPAYIPDEVAELLPMFARFRVRVIAELRLAVDRYESHAGALRVLAIARLAPPQSR